MSGIGYYLFCTTCSGSLMAMSIAFCCVWVKQTFMRFQSRQRDDVIQGCTSQYQEIHNCVHLIVFIYNPLHCSSLQFLYNLMADPNIGPNPFCKSSLAVGKWFSYLLFIDLTISTVYSKKKKKE